MFLSLMDQKVRDGMNGHAIEFIIERFLDMCLWVEINLEAMRWSLVVLKIVIDFLLLGEVLEKFSLPID